MTKTNILIIFFLLLISIGSFLLLSNVIRWKNINSNNLRAKVFLDKSFLEIHFILLMVLTGFTTIHIIPDPLEMMGIVSDGVIWGIIDEGGHIAIMLSLLLMVYLWYRLLIHGSKQI